MTLYGSRQLTGWQAAWLFGGAGLVLLLVAAYMAWQLGIELRTWPRVEARVDSADVTTQPNTTQTSYVARLWLAYRFNGHDYRVPTTTHQGSAEYAAAAKGALDANQAGHVTVLLDPRHPEVADPRVGSEGTWFFAPILVGALGLWFGAFGFAFLMMNRRRSVDRVARASTLSPRILGPAFAGLGALFIVAAAIAVAVGPQGKSWTLAHAQVESADVVRVSETTSDQERMNGESDYGQPMFAVRTWLTYSLEGRAYRTAITAASSRNDSAAVARLASAGAAAGPVDVMIDPRNPYRVVTAHANRADAILIPGILGLIGAVMIGFALLIRRQVSKQHSTADGGA
jgi:hypothetical protein